MNHSTQSDHILQTERHFAFTPEQIHAAFADPARLAAWWGPNGFTNTFETFEFHTGGRWKFVMHGPDDTHYPNESVFQEVEPGKKVVIRHESTPHFTLTVSLQPVDSGTRLHWEQAFDDPKVAAALAHICIPANEQNLDRLTVQLAAAAR